MSGTVYTSTVVHNVGGLNVWADLSCHYEHNVHGQTIIFLIQDLNALIKFSDNLYKWSVVPMEAWPSLSDFIALWD